MLDNAPSHPLANEMRNGEIRCNFLPPNVISLCQPMDQVVLKTFKLLYSHKLLEIIFARMLDRKSVSECLKDVILVVSLWISTAWMEIKTTK